jgi:putative addiction module component (TIGR02574 family)
MTNRAQALLREALALPPDERADVAAELLASLDGTEADVTDAEVEVAWAVEIEKRARRALAGDSSGIPWEEVRRRAEADLRKS